MSTGRQQTTCIIVASMPLDILTAAQERLRGELRSTLGELDTAIAAIGASVEDRSVLVDAVRGLDELFLLVVVGEFNAGKSALLNELIGAPLLPEGVTPTTAQISLVRFGERESEEWLSKGFLERRVPSDALRDLAVVDTPGTNAILRRHEELTREFIPRADLVFFVTSADRPLTETERLLLDNIRAWGKKIVFVVNKVDLLESPTAVDQVRDFVRDGLRTTLGLVPPIFAVSVRLARVAAESRDPAVARTVLAASHMSELRSYVFETLDETERLRLKLATPLGVADRLWDKHREMVDLRLAGLAEDVRLVENVERQIELHATDLRQGFKPRLAEVENVIHELNVRGERFFEDNVRIGKVLDLLNPERTRGAFEREVVTDTGDRIDQVVDGIVDWFVEAEARLWRQITTMIRQRQQEVTGGQETPDFIAARREVLQAVAARARRELSSFDREREAREVGAVLRDAVAQTAIAEIGAVSLGTAIALLFGTVAADFTGLLTAMLLASLGLYIIPARKRKALRQFREKTDELRNRLVQALRSQLDREIVSSTERVREAIAPYTRYVRAEVARIEGERATLNAVGDHLARLRGEIEGANPPP
jgi:small GTP-binding protein